MSKTDDEIIEDIKKSGNYDKVEKIYLGTSDFFYKTTKNNKYGAYDRYEYFVSAPLYDDITLSIDSRNNRFNGEIFVTTSGNKKGALRRQGQNYITAASTQFDDIELMVQDCSEYYIAVTLNGKKGVHISTDRTTSLVVLPPVFDEVSMTQVPNIIVKQYGKYGVYNWDRQVVPIKYDKVEPSYSSIVVTLNNKQGAYYDGNMVVPVGYDEVSMVDPDLTYSLDSKLVFIVKKNNKYGIYNSVPIEFDSITPVYRGFIVEKNGKFGLYHLTKGKILNTDFDKIYEISNTKVACEKNGRVVKEIDMSKRSAYEAVQEGLVRVMFFPIIYPLEHGIP